MSEDRTECGQTVVQRESRHAQGPDISGTWHHYGTLEWRPPISEPDARERPECPVSQLGSMDEDVGCYRLGERITDDDGRGTWYCPWHGVFRVFAYPRQEQPETTQTTLVADGGATE